MTERKPRTVRVDPEVWSAFVGWVEDLEGQKHGELGRHVENALEEYSDNGRLARVEEKVDTLLENADATHTHKASPTDEKVETIAADLERADQTVIPKAEVEDTIGAVAGHDDRTQDKYKDLLKRKGLAYRHPTSGVWTVERGRWMKWANNYVDNDPAAEIHDMLEDYPIGYDEFVQEKTEVPA